MPSDNSAVSNESSRVITVGSRPKRVDCLVVGWFERAWIDLSVIYPESSSGSATAIRVAAEAIPADRRFPNTRVALELLDAAPWSHYIAETDATAS